jgi:hypothetical protein
VKSARQHAGLRAVKKADGPVGDRDTPPFSQSGSADALCRKFVIALPVDGASISVFGTSGRQTTIAASDLLAATLDELQFDLGEGPHWQAMDTARAVLVADLASSLSSAWPMFASAALAHGVNAMFALPLRLGAVVIGAVDLYRLEAGPLDFEEIQAAERLARRAASESVRLAVQSARADARPDAAPAFRREVHQAVGMIVVQLDTTATDAFARLRAYSFATGRPLRDLALDVVHRRLDFSTLPDDGV